MSGRPLGQLASSRLQDLRPDLDRYQRFAITCPFHDDRFWHDLKTNHPVEWADAVAFDHAIRHGSAKANADGHPLRGSYYLHPSRVPLDQAAPRPRSVRSDDQPGCGPWTCPHGALLDPADPADPAGAAARLREVA